MKKIFAAIAIATASFSAWAGTTAFGLELRKSTLEEAQQRFGGQASGINKFSNGPMLEVSPAKVNFEGLSELTLIFGEDKKLVAILATMEKHRFDAVHNMLKGKYKVSQSKLPFVGNKSVTYGSGEDEVELNAPHMSFDMTLTYYTRQFLKSYRSVTTKESKQKSNSEASQL